MTNDILKITKGSMVMMKIVRDMNLYYLKGSIVTAALIASVDSDDDATKLWHMRLDHVGEKSMQTLAKQGLLKDANTYKLEFCEHYVLDKKIKVQFVIAIHRTKGILDYVHTDFWGLSKNASLGGKH